MSFSACVFLFTMTIYSVGFLHILHCCVLNFCSAMNKWLLDGLSDLAGIQRQFKAKADSNTNNSLKGSL